ncbi:MAG: carbohydrate kinase [Synechococcus sp. WH 8007]|nr:carbohydrate kinase [Synechococcus sp. WH 8007]
MQPAPKVICLGEALVDRLGPLGGDPATATAHQCDDRLGGAPANVACALARLGTPAAFVGRLGRDAIGESFEQLLVKRGVELAGLQRDAMRPSRVVLVRRHADGERVFQGFAGDQGQGFSDQALDQAELERAWPALAAQAQWLLVGTIPLATAVSAASLRWAVDQAKAAGVRIALDVNWRPTFWDVSSDPAAGPNAGALSAMQPLIAAASLLKLAKEEALWLFGSADPSVISAGLPQVPDVVVTDGGNPVHWFLGGASGVLEALAPPQVVDTTGAGDAFSSGLLHQLVKGALPPEQMLRFAAACGALVCGGAGAIDPQPDAAAVQRFLER